MGKLSDKAILAAKSKDKQYKLSDGDGLTLLVRTTGAKLWQLRYRIDGKEKTLSIGQYPLVSLADARIKAFTARQSVQSGIDPHEEKKAAIAATQEQEERKTKDEDLAFEKIAREWFAKFSAAEGWVDGHAAKVIRRMEMDIFPWMGKRPINEITPPELLTVIRRMEARGVLESAHRALSTCGRIFRYAVASGLAERDPSSDLRGALPPFKKDKHFAAVTDVKLVGPLMNDIEGYVGSHVVRAAFALSPRVFLRPGELRKLEWKWVSFDDALITIPHTSHKTGKKTQAPHLVPLSTQSIEILKILQPITGHLKYVFPGERDRDRPMSDNAIRAALRRLGWTGEEMTPHGFRAMASTIMDDMGYKPEWLERQLAHDEPNKVKAAYKRNPHLMYMPERRKMMQEWSDYLDSQRDS